MYAVCISSVILSCCTGHTIFICPSTLQISKSKWFHKGTSNLLQLILVELNFCKLCVRNKKRQENLPIYVLRKMPCRLSFRSSHYLKFRNISLFFTLLSSFFGYGDTSLPESNKALTWPTFSPIILV